MQKFIINADDYGLSPRFNQGIIKLAQKNIVTSTTVMVKRDFVDVKSLESIDDISIGLHLELKKKSRKGEVEKQINLFQKLFGQLPSHLDGHQHCHLEKNNLPLVINAAKKLDIPIRSRFPEDRKIIRESGIKTPDEFISWHPERKSKLFERLEEMTERIVELVCHPGYYDPDCSYPYNERRESELKILNSNEFLKEISKFNLINYSSLDLEK